jgi:hypothetical protein
MKYFSSAALLLAAALLITAAYPVKAYSDAARKEFTIYQSLNGAYIMSAFLGGLTVNDDSISALPASAGATTGLAAGYYYSGIISDSAGGVTQGQAQFINGAGFWGASTGWILGSFSKEDKHSTALILSSLFDSAFTMSSAYYAYEYSISSEKAAVLNSGGIWGALYGLQISILTDGIKSYNEFLIYILAGSSAGIGAAAVWGNEKFTRSETAVNDLYGLLGALTGLSIFAVPMLCDSHFSEKSLVIGTLIGSTVGLYMGYSREGSGRGSSSRRSGRRAAEPVYYFRIPAVLSW